MALADPPRDATALISPLVLDEARESVREAVTAGGVTSRPGNRWLVPLGAVAAVTAAAVAPVALPLLTGAAGAAALTAAFNQVGGVGGALLTEAVIRAWDRRRHSEGAGTARVELQDALTEELAEALETPSSQAPEFRAEVAGILRGIGAARVALGAASARGSGSQVQTVLIRGLQELGWQLTEFTWLVDELRNQIICLMESQAEIVASSQANRDEVRQLQVQFMILLQELRLAGAGVLGARGGPAPAAEVTLECEHAVDAADGLVGLACPYPGLQPFGPMDAGLFYGREEEVTGLVTHLAGRIARPGLVMVVGPSGCGKSSLLGAGLLPALAAGALPVRGSETWPVELLTPGERPLQALARRVVALADKPAEELAKDAEKLAKDLRDAPGKLTSAIGRALRARRRGLSAVPGAGPDTSLPWCRTGETGPGRAPPPPRLVLIVDQFEEVFTECKDEVERLSFIRSLQAAAGAAASAPPPREGTPYPANRPRESPALVVIGIRADFYARVAAYPELTPELQDHQLLVGPMDEPGLRAAIEKPAAHAGIAVDPALVEVLLADLGRTGRTGLPLAGTRPGDDSAATADGNGQLARTGAGYEAGRLPLLAHALHRTWAEREKRGERRLTVAAYRATDGLDGAVARTADQVYERLSADCQRAARRLLLRLVSVCESPTDTRRRATIAELTGSPGLAEPADTPQAATAQLVLSALVRERLLTADIHADGSGTVQISHDALLWAWPRLSDWLTEDRDGQRVHRSLTDAARAWHDGGREQSDLFRGSRLAAAREWVDGHSEDLNEVERNFLEASERQEQRAHLWRRFLIIALAFLTAGSAVIAIVAVYKNNQAEARLNQAITNQIVANAERLAATDPSLAAELDLLAYNRDRSPDNAAQVLGAASLPLSNPLSTVSHRVYSVAVSPNRHTVAAGTEDGKVWLWDVVNPGHVVQIGHPLTGLTGPIYSVAFSPGGHTLAAGSGNGAIRLWDVTGSGRPPGTGQSLTGPSGAVHSVTFSSDGHFLAVGSGDAKVWLWRLTGSGRATPLSQLPIPHGAPVYSVAFSPDSGVLAAGAADGRVWLWRLTHSGQATLIGHLLTSPGNSVRSIAFSSHDQVLAAGSGDRVWRWQVAGSGAVTSIGQPLTGPSGPVYSIAFSPDGQTLAVGGHDGATRLWDFTNPAHATLISQPLTGPSGAVLSVAFSPDGHTLVAGYDYHTVRLWNLPTAILTGPGGKVFAVAFSRDGRVLAAGGAKGTIGFWAVASPGRIIRTGLLASGSSSAIESVAFSPHRRILAAGNEQGVVRLWDVANARDPTAIGHPLKLATGEIYSLAFSPDGRTLAVAAGGAASLLNVTHPGHVSVVARGLSDSGNGIGAATFSPDGRLLATIDESAAGAVQLWQVTRPSAAAPFGRTLPGPSGHSVAFSPDGRTLAAGSNSDGSVWLWNVSDPGSAHVISPPLTGPSGYVGSVAFSPDRHTLAAGSNDHRVWLWDVTSPAHATPIGQPLTGPSGAVYSVAFSPDGQILAAGSADGKIWLWDRDVGNAIARICDITSSVMTPVQWASYASPLPYHPPCADYGRLR